MRSLPEPTRRRVRALGLLGSSLLLVVLVRLGLTLMSHQFVRRHLLRANAQGIATVDEMRHVAWAISRASRFVPGATCLTQALAGQVMLSRLGKASAVHLGIERESFTAIKAHAWLVCGEQVVLGGSRESLQRYAPLTVLSG